MICRREALAIMRSHPTWVRGLKRLSRQRSEPPTHVAPHVGAWIETTKSYDNVGAKYESHPTWVRGLKHLQSFLFQP